MSILQLLASFLILFVYFSAPCSAGSIEDVTIDFPKSKQSNTTIEDTTFDIPKEKATADKTLNIQSDEVLPKSNSGVIETTIDVPNKKSYPTKLLKNKKAAVVEKNYGEKTVLKLGNGVVDIVTSVLEIPKTIIATTEEEGLASGLTIGFAKGVANTAGQAFTGAANIVSFPVPQEMENPMKPKKSNIEELDMEGQFGDAFSKPSK